MKVIDLLNKIANGEELPKKIKFDEHIYKYVNRIDELYNYKREDGKYLEEVWMLTNILNSEVEVIEDTPEEDNKIEKIKDYSIMTTMGLDGELQKRKISKAWELEEIVNKINEIIDKVNGDK